MHLINSISLLKSYLCCLASKKSKKDKRFIKPNETNQYILSTLSTCDKIFIFKNLRWATITIWDYKQARVQQFHVFNEEVCHIWFDLGERISLHCDKISKTIRLSNFSNVNIFWTCPILEIFNNKSFKATKLEPGRSVVVFNLKLIDSIDNMSNKSGLIETNIINISLGKYWGHDSKRNSIELCPRWLNVSFNKEYFV